ncbi:unnamed protein product [Moneuplotes crassus]|uniref:Uncharacterized protein n=1 Tax=Euplotes crassus TaxID=5936 RepID=A0AAD2DAV9_EUPCR|nr:unnamed protein product [Moneuplotes crassus]
MNDEELKVKAQRNQENLRKLKRRQMFSLKRGLAEPDEEEIMGKVEFLKKILFKKYQQKLINNEEFLSQINQKLMIQEENRVNKQVVKYLIEKKDIFQILNKICENVSTLQEERTLTSVFECLEIISMATTGVKTRYITEFTEKSDKVMELMLQILAAEDFYPQLCLQVLVVIGNFMLESRDMYKAITTKEILVNEIEYTFLSIIEDFMINSVSNYYSKDYSNENNDLNNFLETLVWLLEIILKSIPDEDCEIHKETLYKSCLATFALLFDFTKTEMINDTSQYKMLYIEDSLCKDSILELLCILIKKPFGIDPNIHPSRCSTPHEKLLQRVVFSPFESLRGYLGEMNEAPAKVYPGALAFLSDCFLYTKYLYDELFSQEEGKKIC